MAAKKKEQQLKITQVKSLIRRSENQKRTIAALGLRRMNQSVIQSDTPELRGMLNKVAHLVRVEEA